MVSHREKNAQRIAAIDEQAERLKLKRGMGIADARAMHPSIEIVEADPDADRLLLESLADWCDRYTPLVAIDGADGLLLDITGCAHLFGGEKALLDDLLARFFHQGFDARAGLASTPGAAWAAARFSSTLILEDGGEKGFLARLPLSALRLQPETRTSLESVGLRTVGAVMQAPRAPLVRRFGKMLILRLDQALGSIEEAISPRLPVPPLSVERYLPEPVSAIEGVEGLIFQLAGTLKEDLERRAEGARALQLLLFRVDGMVSRISIGASHPLREPALVQKLFQERLGALGSELDAGYGFDLIRLSVLETARFDARQSDLTNASADNDEGLAIFTDRIRARHGTDAVLRSIVVESHIPERAVMSVPFSAAPQQQKEPPQPISAERPIRLFSNPELVEVSAVEVPEGAPSHFRWRRVFHKVAHSEGPERIAPEWWHDGSAAPTRDYFRVEDEEGRRFWLYREGLYGITPEPRWFMQGIFA